VSVIPGFNLEQVLDSLAEKVANRLQEATANAAASAIRPRLLTVEQAAAYIGRTKEAVQHMISSGKLPTVRSDRRVFVDLEDLDRWIREHKQPRT
jgi:excisionase family DNA binding protein